MTDEPKVGFKWRRSTDFRTVHADGATGGLTPYGNVFFTLYSDHPLLPDATVHSVHEDGSLGPEISEHKAGIERELEVSVVMSLTAATALRDWLTERIKVLEALEIRAPQRRESEVKS